MNTVQLVGRLGGVPELRALQTKESVATFRLAVSFGSGDKERTDWFDVVTYGRQAETVAKHLVKGQRVGITGYLRVNTWKDKETQENRSRVEVVAGNVEFYDAPKGDHEPPANDDEQAAAAPAAKKGGKKTH